jgi:hypothetical protein
VLVANVCDDSAVELAPDVPAEVLYPPAPPPPLLLLNPPAPPPPITSQSVVKDMFGAITEFDAELSGLSPLAFVVLTLKV